MSSTSPSNLWQQIWLISCFQWKKIFTINRGLIPLAAFGLFWYLIHAHLILKGATLVADPQVKQAILELAQIPQDQLTQLFKPKMEQLTLLWWISLYLLPWITLLITADQTSSDRSRGTLRFITLRTTRTRVFFGYFFGKLLSILSLILSILIITLITSITEHPSLWVTLLHHSILIGLHLFIVLMPYTALMSLCSACTTSARRSLFLAILILIASTLIIGYLQPLSPSWLPLDHLVLGKQITNIAFTSGWQSFNYSYIAILQTLGLLALGLAISNRSQV